MVMLASSRMVYLVLVSYMVQWILRGLMYNACCVMDCIMYTIAEWLCVKSDWWFYVSHPLACGPLWGV